MPNTEPMLIKDLLADAIKALTPGQLHPDRALIRLYFLRDILEQVYPEIFATTEG